MCGLFGTFGILGEEECRRGLHLLRHRGPDGQGVKAVGEAVHGHVRLALVDPSSASSQPFVGAGGSVLTFNGEIWNFKELRSELEATGTRFRTAGDTEVLSIAMERWGEDALPRLDGMFAFVWSRRTAAGWRHVLARDRFGKVPLCVLRRGGTFSWSSERKAWGRLGGSARSLPPGCLLRLESGEVSRWSLPVPPFRGLEEDIDAGKVLELLRIGVRRRLSADAPVCCLISGGLDSSLILVLAAEERRNVVAFSAVLDRCSDDAVNARMMCRLLGVRHVEVKVPLPSAVSLAEAVGCIEVGSKAQAEIAVACLPLARAIASEGFKACLSGEAADELFGGYGNSCIRAASLDDAGWRRHRQQLLTKMARGNFLRCNRVFMSAGVECRLPFMEKKLVEGVLRLGKGTCPPGKGLLKEAASLAGVPRRIVHRVKETFQGGSGVSRSIAAAVHDPLHFVHCEVRRLFGRLVMD